jgi:phage terminase small subunit
VTNRTKFEPDAPYRSKGGKVQLDDPGQYGPAMKAIKPQWRRFVHLYLAEGGRNATRAYIDAGFGSATKDARKHASKLLHDDRVQEALREETKKMLVGAAPLAYGVVNEVLQGAGSAKDKLTAAKMVFDRTGFIAATEHRVHQTSITLSAEQLHLEISAFAKELGLDASKFLNTLPAEPLAIEADYDDVTYAPTLEGLEDLI